MPHSIVALRTPSSSSTEKSNQALTGALPTQTDASLPASDVAQKVPTHVSPSNGTGSPALFRLAPPPPPINVCSVGSTTPADKVVRIESLAEKVAVADTRKGSRLEEEFLGPTGAVYVDDEESLLGVGEKAVTTAKDQPQDPGNASASHTNGADGGEHVRMADRFGDGVDSDSELEDGKQRGSRPDPLTAHASSAPEAAEVREELPPPQPLEEQVQAEAVVDESEEAQLSPAPPLPGRGANILDQVSACRSCSNSGITFTGQTCSCRFGLAKNAFRQASRSSSRDSRDDDQEIAKAVLSPTDDPLEDLQAMEDVSGSKQPNNDVKTFTNTHDLDSHERSKPPAGVQPGTRQTFVVRVPKPYPGVQLRRSKNLEDKHPRYLEDGKTVAGEVDETGKWLILAPDMYLPMEVGKIRILTPVALDASSSNPSQPSVPKAPKEELGLGSWWGCCAGAGAVAVVNGSSDVLVNHAREHQHGDATHSESGYAAASTAFDAQSSGDRRPGGGRGGLAHESSRTSGMANPRKGNQQMDYGAGAENLPRHLSNPIDPFSDSPDAPPLRSSPVRGSGFPR